MVITEQISLQQCLNCLVGDGVWFYDRGDLVFTADSNVISIYQINGRYTVMWSGSYRFDIADELAWLLRGKTEVSGIAHHYPCTNVLEAVAVAHRMRECLMDWVTNNQD